MIVKQGNILKEMNKHNAICFTSNGMIKKNGRLVMGAGIAKAFRDSFLNIDWQAAQEVKSNGNICQIVRAEEVVHNGRTVAILAFPTKNNWRDPSSIQLIKKSARELVDITEQQGWKTVALTKPGCGMGGLNWNEVRKLIEPIFDDRFTVYFL